MKTVVGVLPTLADAQHVAAHLNTMGIAPKNVSVVPGTEAGKHDRELLEKAQRTNAECFARGGVKGAIFCGVLCTVMISLPGVVPFFYGSAAGTLGLALAIGVFFGGVMGLLQNVARTHEEVPLHDEAVREHGVAVAAHLRDELAAPAAEMLREHSAREVRSGADAWAASGYQGALENRHPDPCDSSMTAN